jgi:hypothetical protein
VLQGYFTKRSADGSGIAVGGGPGAAKPDSSSLRFSSPEWRWATLGRGQLKYYENEKERKPKNSLDLASLVVVQPISREQAGRPHTCEVWLSTRKVVQLSFQSAEEWSAWGGVLKACAAWVRLAGEKKESLELPGGQKGTKAKGWLFQKVLQ